MPFLFFLLANTAFAQAAPDACRQIHASLDIGSGSVKVYAAAVNTC